MYNIDEKIKAWYKNQKAQPIVKEEEKAQEKTVSAYSTSVKEPSNVSKRDEIKNTIEKSIIELEKLQNKRQEEEDEELNINPILTDEEIDKKAKEQAEDEYLPKYESENLKNQTNTQKLYENQQNILIKDEAKKASAKKEYDENTKSATDKAIKNGISRSSILSGIIGEYGEEMNGELEKIQAETDNAIKSNNNALSQEEKRHEIKIKEIDANKQKAVKNKIQDLIKEREEIKEKNGLTGINIGSEITNEMVKIQRELITDVLSYYFSMDIEDAIKEYMADTEIQKLLGDLEPTIRLYLTGEGKIS